jgi:CHAD domain-containing protein
VVSKRAWRLSRRIVASAGTIDEHTAATRLHQVRIDAKKLRYLVDATPAFYDASVIECILRSLRKLQQALGDLNDAHLQQKQLLECGYALGIAGGPPGALLTLGRLAEQCHQRYEKLHRRAGEKLRQFRAQDTQSACRRAFKRGWREARVR